MVFNENQKKNFLLCSLSLHLIGWNGWNLTANEKADKSLSFWELYGARVEKEKNLITLFVIFFCLAAGVNFDSVNQQVDQTT